MENLMKNYNIEKTNNAWCITQIKQNVPIWWDQSLWKTKTKIIKGL